MSMIHEKLYRSGTSQTLMWGLHPGTCKGHHSLPKPGQRIRLNFDIDDETEPDTRMPLGLMVNELV